MVAFDELVAFRLRKLEHPKRRWHLNKYNKSLNNNGAHRSQLLLPILKNSILIQVRCTRLVLELKWNSSK